MRAPNIWLKKFLYFPRNIVFHIYSYLQVYNLESSIYI